jgi:cytochrome c oxidase subunit I+III
MYTTGLPRLSIGFFSAASEMVAIPTALQIACLVATVLAGRLVPSVPMLFAVGALAIFVLGGLTGVMVALAPFDFQAHDSYFVVAHLHYVLVGGMLFPVIAAFYYYFPLIRFRTLSERLGKWVFWILFVGFNLAFLPMHLSGLAGMPRRVHTYSGASGLGPLNLVSTIGAFVFAAGFLLFLADVLRPRRRQALAASNPWSAGSLEWISPNPKPSYTPRSIPSVCTRYPLWQQPDLRKEVAEGRHYLPDTEQGYRETLITGTLDAEPQQCLRVPGPSFLPLIAAALTGSAFICSTFYWWAAAAISALAATVALLRWLWIRPGDGCSDAPVHVGRGRFLPVYASGPHSVGWWAMFLLMLADAAAGLSLVFSYLFYWTVHGDFPDRPPLAPAADAWAVATVCMLGAWAGVLAACRLTARSRHIGTGMALGVALLLSIAATSGLLSGPHAAAIDPRSSAYAAMVWLICIWCAAHAALGALMQSYCLARLLAGKIDALHDAELLNLRLYQHFALLTVLLGLALLWLFPGEGH